MLLWRTNGETVQKPNQQHLNTHNISTTVCRPRTNNFHVYYLHIDWKLFFKHSPNQNSIWIRRIQHRISSSFVWIFFGNIFFFTLCKCELMNVFTRLGKGCWALILIENCLNFHRNEWRKREIFRGRDIVRRGEEERESSLQPFFSIRLKCGMYHRRR